MPRIARAVAQGYPHHVTQRGNYRQTVFEEDGDFIQYKTWLKEYGKKFGMEIWAYCLMTNHVHFVCVPRREDSLAKTFNTLHMRYSQYFNRKKGSIGHLWQGRFFSCSLDEAHLYAAIRYIEKNPARAKIVRSPENYKWSSAKSHIKSETDPVLWGDCNLTTRIQDWRGYLMEKEDDRLVSAIRRNSLTGRPCGGDAFIRKIGKIVGRDLMAKKRGRPRKGI